MYENYMLLNRGFQNVRQNNQVIGFQVLAKIAYYRGIFLPLIGDFEITVDGEKFTAMQMNFKIGQNTYSFNELAQAEDVHWDFGKPLILIVLKSGGLKPGVHDVSLVQTIKPSYTGQQGRTSAVTKKMSLVI
jgi:hypothetical protein